MIDGVLGKEPEKTRIIDTFSGGAIIIAYCP